MKAVLDASVLVPGLLRGLLLGAARAGLYQPLWSARLLEEWARAAGRGGAPAEAGARGAIARLRAEFPRAEIARHQGLEDRLLLPDPDDIHVLASAIAGGADTIITANRRDFPQGVLRAEGVTRRDPDGFLWELLSHHPDAMAGALHGALAQADVTERSLEKLRPILKRAGLPRFGKALAG